jgi:ABC-type glycerol-3-phosphate transport system permease component
VTAIGQPFEPVAPVIGTGGKMNTNWHFRSTISSSNEHALMLPVVVFSVFVRCYLVRGLTAGGSRSNVLLAAVPAAPSR